MSSNAVEGSSGDSTRNPSVNNIGGKLVEESSKKTVEANLRTPPNAERQKI